MTNILSDDKRQQVLALGRLGWPLRRIEQATGVRRETASAYLKAAGLAVRPPGRWGHPLANPAKEVSTDPGAYSGDRDRSVRTIVIPPTQSQTLPGSESSRAPGEAVESLTGWDVKGRRIMAHERAAAGSGRSICPPRQSGAGAAAPFPRAGGPASARRALPGVPAAGPAVCRSGSAPSPRGTGPATDRGVHGQIARGTGATSPDPRALDRQPFEHPRGTSARGLAGAGAARTPGWVSGGSSTPTCLTAWG